MTSDSIRARFEKYDIDDPSLPSLSPHQLWYEWGADKACFISRRRFQRFLEMAGMDRNTKAVVVSHRWYIYRSPERDVVIVCSENPMDDKWGHAHYLGVTGERGKVGNMADWFQANCDGHIERGSREYI